MGQVICAICGAGMRRTHSHTILNKYVGQFVRCDSCGYWKVLEPHWIQEAYNEAIAATDTGILQRNLQVGNQLSEIIDDIAPTGPYVDWAGGLGILTRLMRDRGYDFYWHDVYAQNQVARGFEWTPHAGPATLVTAIEVLEHITSPLDFVQEIRAATATPIIVFSQETYDQSTTFDWWYFSYETGQHVSFFSRQTLTTIAERCGMHYQFFGGLHMWSEQPLVIKVPTVRRLRAKMADELRPASARASLTWIDHETIAQRMARARKGRDQEVT